VITSQGSTNAPFRLSPGWLFVFPYLLFLAAFGVGPAWYIVVISFFDTKNPTMRFNGLENYQTVVSDFRFLESLRNPVLFTLLWLPLMVVCVLGLALLLHVRRGRFSETMRLLYYLPGAVAGPANVLLWIFMFDPSVSPFGWLMNLFGLKGRSEVLGLANLPVIFTVMVLFTTLGAWVVTVYTSLMSIPQEIYEAATVDGCDAFQMARFIKVPLVSKQLLYMVVLNLALGFQLIVEPTLLYSATLGAASSPAWSINQLASFYANNLQNFGAAAAISVGLLVLSLLGVLFLIFGTDFYRIEGEAS
jgi:multiple sugar transport system permease protein